LSLNDNISQNEDNQLNELLKKNITDSVILDSMEIDELVKSIKDKQKQEEREKKVKEMKKKKENFNEKLSDSLKIYRDR
jgi:hypothetical protein